MSALFTPLTITGMTLRNRVVMPPMVTGFGEEGRVTDRVLEHYARRAEAGTGMIIVEAAAVDRGGRCWTGGLNAYHDDDVPGLAQLAARIRAAGAVAGIQLVHGGPQGSPELNGRNVGPSAVAPSDGASLPRMLRVEEIAAIQDRFADAAARVVAAGFQMVEIHGAHGFLIDSFLSPVRNTRTDQYGGTPEKRMRMIVETCEVVRTRIGDSALLACRTSIFNHLAEGFSEDDLRLLIPALESAGLDLIDLSTDGVFNGYFGSERGIGQWVKELTTLPIIAAGGLRTPADADRAIADGYADLAAIGHGLLDDPDWTVKAQEALG